MKYKQLFLLIALLFVVSCATPYQKYSWYALSGGYNDKKIDNDKFEIKFTSNATTPLSKTKEYALLRSAEVTIDNGFKYFIVNDQNLNYENVQHSCTHDRHRRQTCQNVRNHAVTNKITCYNKKPSNKNKIYDAALFISDHK